MELSHDFYKTWLQELKFRKFPTQDTLQVDSGWLCTSLHELWKGIASSKCPKNSRSVHNKYMSTVANLNVYLRIPGQQRDIYAPNLHRNLLWVTTRRVGNVGHAGHWFILVFLTSVIAYWHVMESPDLAHTFPCFIQCLVLWLIRLE